MHFVDHEVSMRGLQCLQPANVYNGKRPSKCIAKTTLVLTFKHPFYGKAISQCFFVQARWPKAKGLDCRHKFFLSLQKEERNFAKERKELPAYGLKAQKIPPHLAIRRLLYNYSGVLICRGNLGSVESGTPREEILNLSSRLLLCRYNLVWP
jgi:hypothetical protein